MYDHKILENSLESLQLLYVLCLSLITCMKPRNMASLFWYISSTCLKHCITSKSLTFCGLCKLICAPANCPFPLKSLAVREFLCLDDPPGPFDSLEESRVSAVCVSMERGATARPSNAVSWEGTADGRHHNSHRAVLHRKLSGV